MRSRGVLKVGIDAFALGSGAGGDERYLHNVVHALSKLDSGADFTLFLAPSVPEHMLPSRARMRRVVVRPSSPVLHTPAAFPLALARERIDVAHVQYMASPICPARLVVSVHDIAYERYPEFFTPLTVAKFRLLVPLTVRRAATVLTLSEFSKGDIVRRYCVPPDKVVVAPCAADPIFRPLRDAMQLDTVRERYRTGDRFILCVGNLQPRKNLRTLIEAYVRLRRADATRHKLVLVGRKAWLYDAALKAARISDYKDDVVFTDYVSNEDLVALYNAAELFVYPSIFEGFGLPPLEAMACGTPVITANTSALPEVVGDAAMTVDPLDVEALASAIATILGDTGLQAQYSRQGLRRAAAFSWETTARTVMDVYRGVAGRAA